MPGTEEALVVVGAGAAGLTAVDALRRQGFADPIVLVGAESHLPYDRPPLSKGFLLGTLDRTRITLRDPQVLADLGIELLLGRVATAVDTAARRLELDDGSVLRYSRLIVATGVRPARPAFLDGHRGVHVLRTVDDAERLAHAMGNAASAIVIGGGLLGYELAASARSAGLNVTLVDRSRVPLAHVLGPVAGGAVAQLHREHGVVLRTGRSVRAATTASGTTIVSLDDGSTLSADLVVAAVGSHPNVEWLAGSGLDTQDGVGCDHLGRAASRVYAIGDVARWSPPDGRGMRIEHRTNATQQALAVAGHIAAGTEPAPAAPYFWTDQFAERIQVAGHIGADADSAIVAGDVSARRFVIKASRRGSATGVLGWRMAKDFARHRGELAGAY